MNSLVVLFSVLVLATASPSVFLLNGYAAPVSLAGALHIPKAALLKYVTPVAVSYQFRLDIKNFPAIVDTHVADSIISNAALVAVPVVKIFAAPTVIAPAAHQSHTDINSTSTIAFASAAAVPIGTVTSAGIAPAVVKTADAITPIAHSPHLTTTATTSNILKTAHATPALATTAVLAASVSDAIAAPSVTNDDDPDQIDPRSVQLEAKSVTKGHLIH